jgi:hypothetical protein
MTNHFAKLPVRVFFFALFVYSTASQAQCTCTPTTKITHQERTVAKHEKHSENFSQRKDTITVWNMALWDKKYKAKTDTLSDNPKSKRMKKSPEDTLYLLRGYMWFVKREKNDCDHHIEIGKKNIDSSRIVVEVLQSNCDLQKKIDDKLAEKNLKKGKHFKEGIPCLIMGLGFYDASHRSDGNHGDIHTQDHIWELHPVTDIVWE